MPALPTAMQLSDAPQDTELKVPPSLGLGVGVTDHVEPSHDSARMFPEPDWPTAMQRVAFVQETP